MNSCGAFSATFLIVCLLFLVGCQAESTPNTPLALASEFIDLLQDQDAAVRRTAALSLGKIASPPSEPALVVALKDPDPVVREYSAWALGQLGEVIDNNSALALVGALGDEHAPVKRAAAQALGRIGTRKAVLELLNEGVLVGRTESRRYAIETLMQLENGGPFSTYVAASQDPDARVRQGAVAGLGELGDSQAIPVFRRLLLNDPDVGVRAEAAYRLGKLGTIADLPTLQRSADLDPDPLVHLWATWAIENINPSASE